jgi:ABC-type antimicrobial peptide transport system ATPase subunit
MGAFLTRARAIERRCFCPPETFIPPCATSVCMPSGFVEMNSVTWAMSAANFNSWLLAFSSPYSRLLSIARALVKKAPIYIFDDSFSALDFKTDAALRKALKEHTGSSTMMIVTQRIATIKNAEQIIVLDEGKIVGKGSHDELMKDCEVYRGIALSQLSKEELA